MKRKTKYRIRNWSDYNRSLEQRGSLTVWMSDDAIENWLHYEKSGNRGASRQYSDTAIQTMATLKAVFHQAGRQTVGLVNSLFELMKINLPVPEHSTISRRMETLEVSLTVKTVVNPRHIVVDSTGVKVYGEVWNRFGLSVFIRYKEIKIRADERIKSAASRQTVSGFICF
jgi:hypothetical protein